MLYIAICDDDEQTVQVINKNLKRHLKHHNLTAEVSLYTKSSLLLYDIQEGRFFDLILSDIEMPQIDGIELTKSVKKYLPDILIIQCHLVRHNLNYFQWFSLMEDHCFFASKT